MYKSVLLSKNLTTAEAIIEFLDNVYSSLIMFIQQSTIAVYLDFSKAVYTIYNETVSSYIMAPEVLCRAGLSLI